MSRLFLCFGGALLLGGAALLGLYLWDMHEAAQAQQRAKAWLNRAAVPRTLPGAQSAVPYRPPVRRGDALGELEIPRLHLSVMVFEGDDTGILKIGAGHIPGTSLSPGKGNVGIAAHRDTFFRPLRAIHTNDVIAWRTPVRNVRFAVTRTEIVRPSDISVLSQAPGRDLTLVTCYPFSYIGHAPKRFIVYAQRLPD
jgi:LPXTG-site transpeptidase (sortase) family protein